MSRCWLACVVIYFFYITCIIIHFNECYWSMKYLYYISLRCNPTSCWLTFGANKRSLLHILLGVFCRNCMPFVCLYKAFRWFFIYLWLDLDDVTSPQKACQVNTLKKHLSNEFGMKVLCDVTKIEDQKLIFSSNCQT